jgi:hypothetical protein
MRHVEQELAKCNYAEGPVVYFLQLRRGRTGGPIKIGTTSDFAKRLRTLSPMYPWPLKILGVVIGNYETETELHYRFSSLHMHGEWFRPAPELVEFIKSARIF